MITEEIQLIQPLLKTGKFTRIFRKQKSLSAGLILLGFISLLSVFSGFITPHDPIRQGDLSNSRYLSPSAQHPFGTDKFGRDVFSRVLYGGRISLFIAFSVVLLSSTIGLGYGAVAGYFGGKTDAVFMRLLDFLLAFPAIFLIITLMALFQPGHWFLIPFLSFTSWMEIARLIRAEVLSLKEKYFVAAARAQGFTNRRILLRHIIPNCLTPLIVIAPLKIGEIILLESALSFLGIGVQPPVPSWGNIINDGREALLSAWWISAFPGMFIVMSVLSFNLIGNGLKKYFRIG